MPYAQGGRKVCSACRTEFDLSAFCSNRAQKDGLSNQCRDCLAESRRKNYFKDHEKSKRLQMESHRRRRWGLMPEQFRQLCEAVGNACPGCGRTPPEISFAVDHDHANGRVRGVLCTHCNLAVGHVADDPAVFRALADYLMKFEE